MCGQAAHRHFPVQDAGQLLQRQVAVHPAKLESMRSEVNWLLGAIVVVHRQLSAVNSAAAAAEAKPD